MFARQADASKVGLVTLSAHLQQWGFVLNDGKRDSGHLRSLGFDLMPRSQFNALMAKACQRSPAGQAPGRWTMSIDVFQWNPKGPPGLAWAETGFYSTVTRPS